MSARTIKGVVARITHEELHVEYDSHQNKLRVADRADNTLAVLTDDAVYQVAPAAPTGHVIVRKYQNIPDLIGVLTRQGVVETVNEGFDPIMRETATTARMLI
ncbi:hypothetical protein [Arthrobacter bambusae]|uniref:Ribulose 1,5-bisphosphate synthetase/thiazole synthase n=1 Tax=Arthrobacter bambusae TaxID=1338426 RepID=A0AAW8DGB7_9MICC|nr:hypothetical protein [Arthrobacter bambusae]MDP9904697.1 ribulose 1,5-bisphosphate synthetase/thiazole synthase [Arthrobacter bambusae]MDQ0129513.1 ribulose 1,5-bisphosphate synthetase/thiazole synthase [Arthrobacter bambusae]MDQ0180874.1 ribulose 1,5-bisphosphate synthetase/thiazole synthase [Arthrobacter bambusae]